MWLSYSAVLLSTACSFPTLNNRRRLGPQTAPKAIWVRVGAFRRGVRLW